MDQANRFRVTVLAPLFPREAFATSERRRAMSVALEGKGALDAVLARVGAAVKLDVPDPLGGPGESLRVDLSLTELARFRPDGIAAEVPALKALLSARPVIEDLLRRGSGRDEARRELERVLGRPAWAATMAGWLPEGAKRGAAAPAAAPAAAASVDALLDLVEVAPPEDPGAQQRAVSSLISSIARGGPSGASAAGSSLRARVEAAYGALLWSILDHPEVRRLERTARGLRLLANAAPASVVVDVIPFAEGHASDALAHVVDDIAGGKEAPELLVLDLETALDESDLPVLSAAGEIAESLRAPLLVSGSAALLETNDEGREQRLRALAGEPWAAWVVLATNGALVRGPFTPESSRLRDPRLTQPPDAPGARVFASAAYVLGCLAARSFAALGWPSDVHGPEAGVLGGFDVHTDDATESALATEKLVGPEAAQKHARRGLVALTCVPNRDTVACVGAPTLGRGPSLSDQLFVARFAGLLAQIAAAIPPGTDARAAAEVAVITLTDRFPAGGMRTPQLSARVEGGALVVTIAPRRFAGTSAGEFVLDAPLGE